MESMERKINGKSFQMVLDELKKPFEKDWVDNFNNKYLPIEEVEDRLDQVLGLNYSFLITQPIELIEIEETVESTGEQKPTRSFVGTGEIIVYDDQGIEVCRRAAGNGTNFITFSSTNDNSNRKGLIKDLTNDYNSAVSLIKKKCAMNLGVGRYLTKEKNQGKGSSKGNKNVAGTTSKLSTILLTLESKATSSGDIIKFKVLDKKGQRKGEMVIFKDATIIQNETKFKKLMNVPVGTDIKVKLKKEHLFMNTLQFIVDDVA